MAFDIFGTKAVRAARALTTQKRDELPSSSAALGRAVCGWKALDCGSLNMQFQQDGPKDKKITAL